ncbi:hypothetical protein [Allosalinactinospora lopnorensis]|uniref:hypothetical protein n=1 Tax=Allosalinactinospora lopnorensis TaxID=1352348 RepID=UPI000623F677|nr:hypothetical protein [Allosalinactinospora lopnorensis]
MNPALIWATIVTMPLSYAVEAMEEGTSAGEFTAGLATNMGVVLGFVLLALSLGAAILRRRNP